MNVVPGKLPAVFTYFLQLALIVLGPLTVFIVANFTIFQYAHRDIDASVEHAYTEVDLVLPVRSMVLQSTIPVTSYLVTGKVNERKQFEESVGNVSKALARLADHMKLHEDEHNLQHDVEAELAQGFAHEFEMVEPIQTSWKRVETRARKLMQMRTSAKTSQLAREIELMNADAENTATLLNDLYRKIKHKSRQEIRDVIYEFILFPVFVSAAVGLWLFVMLVRVVRNKS